MLLKFGPKWDLWKSLSNVFEFESTKERDMNFHSLCLNVMLCVLLFVRRVMLCDVPSLSQCAPNVVFSVDKEAGSCTDGFHVARGFLLVFSTQISVSSPISTQVSVSEPLPKYCIVTL